MSKKRRERKKRKPTRPASGPREARDHSRQASRGSENRATSRRWPYVVLLLVAVVAIVWWAVGRTLVDKSADDPREAARTTGDGAAPVRGELTITYPLDGTMFPPEIVPPTFCWEDTDRATNRWSLEVDLTASASSDVPAAEKMRYVVDASQWTPTHADWEAIKRGSVDEPARITVAGFDRTAEGQVLTSAEVRIATSSDEVGAPIFYREVNLPFSSAVRDPAEKIRWRFGTISAKGQPPVVLEKMPVCGNCHSFTADGQTMSMDVDFANDKGSYAICPVSEDMLLCRDNIITWSDFRRKDKKKTFGLLSQVSPDGRYVVSTVKDLSVFLAIDDNLAFSQLFFPVQGILCYYDRQTETFHTLPGADDPKYVQSNPVWSPDGKHIVFARSEAYEVSDERVNELGLSVPEEVPDFVSGEETFLFDLYRIPFNDGQGGESEPLEGASGNGKSNYFPKYSPDGKWIVFCQAESFMLLQPDSLLYLIPAAGGEARRLECNTDLMNSWHSWSPNSKWLVFSSKAYTLYTQLMLTHIDERGHATPPVVLTHFTAPDRAANIPEFVNTSPDAIKRINFDDTFFADAIHINAGDNYARQGDFDRAVEEFQRAIAANPDNAYPYRAWSRVVLGQGKLKEAEELLRKARELAPEDRYVSCQLGQVLRLQGRAKEAERMFRDAIRIDSSFSSPYLDLAALLLEQGKTEQGRTLLKEAIRIKPDNPQSYCLLGDSLSSSGETTEAVLMYSKALEKDANCFPALVRLAQILSTSPDSNPQAWQQAIRFATRACELTKYQRLDALVTLSDAYAAAGNFGDAASVAEKAFQIAAQSNDPEQVNMVRSRLQRYGKR